MFFNFFFFFRSVFHNRNLSYYKVEGHLDSSPTVSVRYKDKEEREKKKINKGIYDMVVRPTQYPPRFMGFYGT